MRVDDLLRRQANARPRGPAVTCGTVTWTYSELNDRCNRLANALRACGLRQGDRAAIFATNCHRYNEFHFACSKAGVIAVPVNPRLVGPELHYILEDAGAAAVVADADHAETLSSVVGSLPQLGAVIGYGKGHGLALDYEALLAKAALDDPMIELPAGAINVIGYTSGTTGRPKGAMLTHHTGTMSAAMYAVHLGLGPDDRALAAMPAYVYRGGSAGIAPVAAGAHTFVAPFKTRPIMDLIERERLTYAMFAPAMINLLMREPDFEARDFSSLRGLWTGGAPIREETLDRLIATVGDVVGAVYGMTEATGIASMRHRASGPRRLLSVGHPLPLLDVDIRTADGSAAAPEEVGEITVRGDTVMVGYWNDPTRTAEVLRDGWFSTGDMGYVDAEGYLYIVDRRNDIINSGGINVYSLELENVLSLLPGVLEVAIVGAPDDVWGEAVVAYIVREPDAELTENDVLEHCRAHLAGYKKPRRIEFRAALPRNEMGKVDKKVLREPLWANRERSVNG